MDKTMRRAKVDGRSIEQEVLVYKPRLSRDMTAVIEAKAELAKAKDRSLVKKEE